MKSKKSVIVMPRENAGNVHENLRPRQALVARLTLCDNHRHGHENLRLRQALVARLTLCHNQRHGHVLVARLRSCVRKCRTSMRMPSNTPRNCKTRVSFFYAAFAHMKEALMKWRLLLKI
jgi:hypothetical protein